MSTDLESDSELNALRNELLNGLIAKQVKLKKTVDESIEAQSKCNSLFSDTNNNHVENDEENELERLRLQALNAKRNKKNLINSSQDFSLQSKAKSNLPGRFRYDRDSADEEEEEDDESDDHPYKEHKNPKQSGDSEINDELCVQKRIDLEFNAKHMKNFYQDSDSLSQVAIQNNYFDQTEHSFDKRNEFNNYHCNYQTYRVECSKLMANDAYDPNSIYEPQNSTLPEDFDLRNFLREKALKQQEQIQSETDDFPVNNSDELVCLEPITKPIEIEKELLFSKYRKRTTSRYNYDINYMMTANKNNYLYDRKRKSTSKSDPINDHNENFINSTESLKMADQPSHGTSDSNNEYESDDDSSLSNKKLKSVVAKAFISNDKNTESSLIRHEQKNPIIKDRPSYQRHSSHYKRK